MSKDIKKVITPKFRVSFPKVFTPEAMEEGQDKKYSICMLFDKGEDLSKLKALVKHAAKEKFGDNIPKNLRLPFRDQGEKEYDGYVEGAIFCNASSKHKPGVVGPNPKIALDEEEFYPGCYAVASVTAYGYDVKGNKGVALGLGNVQKVAEGEPLGNRVAPEAEFEAIEGTADSEFLLDGEEDDDMFG